MNPWDTPDRDRHRRHHHHRHHRHSYWHSAHHAHRPFLRNAWGTRYVQVIVVFVAIALLGRLAWQGVKYMRHPANGETVAPLDASLGLQAADLGNSVTRDPDLRETLAALDESAQSAAAGDLGPAENDADRAGSILVTMRLNSGGPPQEFFARAAAGLDAVVAARPDNALLVEHVTQTRIDLAELRSSMGAAPSTSAAGGVLPASVRRVMLSGPREVIAQSTLDPAVLGGSYLDATQMPDSEEILLPPTTRSLVDGVHVERLTLAGAAQTLDGIHWRNVTFVGTHLRYEGGPLDLENVHFVRCRFGFVSNARGARLATVIALGQATLALE